MLNTYYDTPIIYKRVRVYLGAGAGYAEINPNNAFMSSDEYKVNTILKSQKTQNFSYSIMTCITCNIYKKLDLDVGYKFQDYGRGKSFKSYESYIASEKRSEWVYKEQKKFRIKAHNLTIGLRYTL